MMSSTPCSFGNGATSRRSKKAASADWSAAHFVGSVCAASLRRNSQPFIEKSSCKRRSDLVRSLHLALRIDAFNKLGRRDGGKDATPAKEQPARSSPLRHSSAAKRRHGGPMSIASSPISARRKPGEARSGAGPALFAPDIREIPGKSASIRAVNGMHEAKDTQGTSKISYPTLGCHGPRSLQCQRPTNAIPCA
jgi:hypothetical protein